MPEPPPDTIDDDLSRIPSFEIRGIRYFPTEHAAQMAGVTRQTLWRWRRDGKVPSGCRYRDQQIVFTANEIHEICAYAQRLEPTLLAATQKETDPKDINA